MGQEKFALLANGLASAVVVLVVGFAVWATLKTLSYFKVIHVLGVCWRQLMRFLVGPCAWVFGMRLRRQWRRNSVTSIWVITLIITALLAPLTVSLSAAALSILMLFCTFLVWGESEAEKEANILPEDCKYVGDYRDETIVAVLALFLVVPIVFARFDESTSLMTQDDTAFSLFNFQLGYAAYILGELIRAIPVFDVFEVYGLENPSGSQPTTGIGQHTAFGLRVVYDVVIITGLLRLFVIYNRQQTGAELRELKHAIEYGPDERAARLARAFRPFGTAITTLQKDLQYLSQSNQEDVLSRVLLVCNAVSGRLGGTQILESALRAARGLVTLADREADALDWATTQNNLGNALADLALMRNDKDLIEQAIDAYHQALKERTRDRVPLDWATTQNNLGLALRQKFRMSGGTDSASLEEALDIYAELAAFYREREDEENEKIYLERKKIIEELLEKINLGEPLGDLTKLGFNFDAAMKLTSTENERSEYARQNTPFNRHHYHREYLLEARR